MNEEYFLPVGALLKRGCYKIMSVLGEGGFNIIYLAKEIGEFIDGDDNFINFRSISPENQRDVVIKELYLPFCMRGYGVKANASYLANMLSINEESKRIDFEKLVNREFYTAKFIIKLQREKKHTHIIETYQTFKENGTVYTVMEYLKGQDLGKLLENNKRLDINKAIKYFSQISDALSFLHEKQILHLDVCPNNIFIKEDTNEAVLIDLDSSFSFMDSIDNEGMIISKNDYYSPPEQGQVEILNLFRPQIDTFSLAGTFYHSIIGERPISPMVRISEEKESKTNLNLKLHSETMGISDYWDAFVEKGLSINNKNRFQTVEEFKIALLGEPNYEHTLSIVEEAIIANDKLKAEEYLEKALPFSGFLTGRIKTLISKIGVDPQISIRFQDTIQQIETYYSSLQEYPYQKIKDSQEWYNTKSSEFIILKKLQESLVEFKQIKYSWTPELKHNYESWHDKIEIDVEERDKVLNYDTYFKQEINSIRRIMSKTYLIDETYKNTVRKVELKQAYQSILKLQRDKNYFKCSDTTKEDIIKIGMELEDRLAKGNNTIKIFERMRSWFR